MRATALVVLVALAGCSKTRPAPAQQPVGKLRLITAPSYPDAAVVIADQLAQTQAAHRKLLVYVGAKWCEPCQRFHEAAAKGEFDSALPDVDLLVFDADKDDPRLEAAGYSSRLIPLFAIPGPDGRSTGQQTEGAMKGPKMVSQLVARVQVLLSGG